MGWGFASRRIRILLEDPVQKRRVKPGTGPRVKELDARVQRQGMLLQALVGLLFKKKLIEKAEFKTLMEEIDLKDGVRDGKLSLRSESRACPSCGWVNRRDIGACQLCGVELKIDYLRDDLS